MGHALSNIARKLLTDGIHTHYPSIQSDLDPAERFSVCQRKAVPSEYVIMDKDTKFHVWIPQASLEYPSFDLVKKREWHDVIVLIFCFVRAAGTRE